MLATASVSLLAHTLLPDLDFTLPHNAANLNAAALVLGAVARVWVLDHRGSPPPGVLNTLQQKGVYTHVLWGVMAYCAQVCVQLQEQQAS